MAHKTLIGGTEYEISGGRTLVDGTGYDITKGRTLVDGTGYDILMLEPKLIGYFIDETPLQQSTIDYTWENNFLKAAVTTVITTGTDLRATGGFKIINLRAGDVVDVQYYTVYPSGRYFIDTCIDAYTSAEHKASESEGSASNPIDYSYTIVSGRTISWLLLFCGRAGTKTTQIFLKSVKVNGVEIINSFENSEG